MNNILNEYKFYQDILLIFDKGFEDRILEDECVYDAVLDYMDLLWGSLTKNEKESLRKVI